MEGEYSHRFLGHIVKVEVDRPMGSRHPTHHDIFYPVNYGFVPDTTAPDGNEIDAYILGVFEPLKEFVGRCVAIIHRTDDEDDKLVIAPEGQGFSDEQIRALTEFQERFFQSEIRRQ